MTHQQRMVQSLLKLAPNEGYTSSILDDVRFMRSNRCMPRMPVLYDPSIFVILQGKKLGYIGNQVFQYDPQQFLVLSLPLPFESETIGTEKEPMLGVCIRINLAMVAELVLQLDEDYSQLKKPPLCMISTTLDHKLSDAMMRLLEVLSSPSETKVLGDSVMREIYYRVLTGAQGATIRKVLMQHSNYSKISKALKCIHINFSENLSVSTLANEASMSVPAFYSNFKALTATSPMQYLKTTRLHKARLHMLEDGMSASAASRKVGYESSSQFSREFKRFFGRTPIDEVTALKQSLNNSVPASATTIE